MKSLIWVSVFLGVASGHQTAAEESFPATHQEAETSAHQGATPDEALRELIRGARDLVPVGDAVWSGYAAAPFGILLVEEDVETLLCHHGPAADFRDLGVDPITGCRMKGRPRTLEPNLLAAFPAVDDISTVVIGTPEATGLQPLDWRVTLLHEHFHQMQTSLAGYYDRVNALGLAGAHRSGMWMLNYPFPYDSAEANSVFGRLAEALIAAVEAIGTGEETPAVDAYIKARAELRPSVSDADWRYFEFQLWQEGVARWTEMAIAGSADDVELRQSAVDQHKKIMNSLKAAREQGLKIWKRSAFYPVGAAEAMLLDARGDEWRTRYFAEPFALGPYFEPAPAP